MKALRIVLLIVAGLVLLLLLAVALLLVPAVQRVIVTRALSGPDKSVEIDYLRVGFSRTQVRELVYTEPGATYRVEKLQADLSLSDLLFRRDLRIDQLNVTGLVIDIVEMIEEREERDPESDEPFEGILRQIELPMPVYLKQARVEGVVLLPGTGEEPMESKFVLTGGGLAPGEEGQFELASVSEDPAPGAPIAKLDLGGAFFLRQNDKGTHFERIAVDAEIRAAAGESGRDESLRVDATLAQVEGGETYFAAVRSGEVSLLSLNAQYVSRERSMQGEWEVQVDREQIAAVVREAQVPDISVRGKGAFSYGAEAARLALAGEWRVAAEDLGNIAPNLRELGAFALHVDFDLAVSEEELHLAHLVTELRDAEGQSLLEARNFQPVIYDRQAERLIGAEEQTELLSVSLQNLPVGWANLFLHADDPREALRVEGGAITGQLLLTAQDGSVAFRLTEPLRAEGISVQSGAESLLSNVALEAAASGFLREGVMEALLDRLSVSSAGAVILEANGRYDGGADGATGRIEVNLPALLAQPAFAAMGAADAGTLTVDVTVNLAEVMRISAAGALADFVWRDFPEVVLSATFNAGLEESVVRVHELLAEARDGAGQTLLEARNFQPFQYDLEAARLVGAEAGLDLLTVSLQNLPLAWANGFIQGEDPEEEQIFFESGVVSGQIVARGEPGAVSFRFLEPVTGSNISARQGSEQLLREISFEGAPSGSWRDGEVEVQVDRFRVSSGAQPLLLLSGRYNSTAAEAAGQVQASMAGILSQPFAADYDNASSGILSLDIKASFDNPTRFELSGDLRDLVLRREGQVAPPLSLQVTVTEVAENQFEIDAPLHLEARQPSDLRLSGNLATGAATPSFQLQLTSQTFRVEDFMLIADAFSSDEDSAPAVPDQPSERDEAPFWNGAEGNLSLQIERLVLPGEHEMEEVQGTLQTTASSLVTDLQGRLLQGPVTLQGEVEYVAENERPYALTGSLEAPNVSSGEFFRASQPNRPPTVEGIFTAAGSFRGDGENLQDLIERVQFQFRMKTQEGVFRLFYSEKPLANIGMALGGILGGISPEVRTVTDIARMLSHVEINELELSLERDENLNFLLRNLTLISPELQLQGVGEVRHTEGVAALLQPMRIQLQPAVRGSLERSFNSLGILAEERDEGGYRTLRQNVVITGTPANPDTSNFYRMLAEAAIGLLAPKRNENEEETQQAPALQGILEGIFRDLQR